MPSGKDLIISRFGSYEILETLGKGGMSTVYKASSGHGRDVVALKVANRAVAADQVLSQRFAMEFKIASQLQHAHLVRALGCGKEGNTPYLVMEYVPGQSLDKQLKDKGPLTIPEALRVFSQIGEALGFMHRNNLVHRDIKPGNILIDPVGNAKLADLGLIKDLDSTSMITQSRTGLGTLVYAAPEQFDDAKHVDLRCDIYALAATLYVSLTGKFPFGPGGQMRVLKHKLEHQFTPLSQLIEGISPALEQAVNRALHPDPSVRPPSMATFVEDIHSERAHGSVWQPKQIANVAAAVQERRGDARHLVQVNASFGMVNVAPRDAWPAVILDISASGLCMQIPTRFEINTILNIFLLLESGVQKSTRARACWIKEMPDDTWLLGCLFSNPLPQEELDKLLFCELSETDILKKGGSGSLRKNNLTPTGSG